MQKKNDSYEDIIHLPHHQSKVRPHMSLYDRAAQFSPFAALTGHEAAIQERARLTKRQLELDETEKTRLDWQLGLIRNRIAQRPTIRITYFKKDEKKEGGSYVTIEAVVKKLDPVQRKIILENYESIDVDLILELELPEAFGSDTQ